MDDVNPRSVPRTDSVLDDPRLTDAIERLGRARVKDVVRSVLQAVRTGEVSAECVVAAVIDELPDAPTSMRPVINATGIVVHTNLGRAPLSRAACDAMLLAAGTTDVELDLDTGRRGPRGLGAVGALTRAVPAAEAAHIVNNGAAAIVLCAATFAAGREIVVSRGELVEIGDRFRIPEVLEAAGASIREVGTTNRTALRDYEAAIGADTAFVLKVHPSNFVVSGFTASVPVRDLAGLPVPVVVDIGSGLLRPHPLLPDEPDASSTLDAGAALVTASGDKLLGGPQAGLILGRAELVQSLRRHPLARALRVDKLTLAALEATMTGPTPPVVAALQAPYKSLRERAGRLHRVLTGSDVPATVIDSEARVGGGGAPNVILPSVAIRLPEAYAGALRAARMPVLGRIEQGHCVLDLRTVLPEADGDLATVVIETSRSVGQRRW
ncbi:L-seryl-tRNA(Sec) selenium transferase [Phytoactinopolyspora limicola]|uniref:L-seryl-tRNA(Sec) selenium transferase n=1 Tax=Phytoactinopolyspora limicola TaxID=2715536 RepID=UPI00140C330D|nr:L-seryl-tRNA(Sec) selenium transferase [Phytoactinopolyspora limicola]